ncbi:hypothetical protein EDB84DRAFT_1441021 [Lactarius hengduanensis]|nr:hypothetical protein EDB84DRAFT_1441021 [Lactarius hengduanensis]
MPYKTHTKTRVISVGKPAVIPSDDARERVRPLPEVTLAQREWDEGAFRSPPEFRLAEPARPEHPGPGWKIVRPTEPYSFDILFEDGTRGPPTYIRFAINQKDQPVTLDVTIIPRPL